MEQIKHDYTSPRWTAEYPDCSMPMTFDTYSVCSFGCIYCLDGDTPITMWDHTSKPLKDVQIGDELVGVAISSEGYPKVKKSTVLNKWKTLKETFRVTLADGRSVVCSADHRWYTDRGWKKTYKTQKSPGDSYLTTKNKILSFNISTQRKYTENESYMAGYLNGMIRGDANFKTYEYDGNPVYRFRLAIRLETALRKTKGYLEHFGIFPKEFLFPMIDRKTKETIQVRAIRVKNEVEFRKIEKAVKWQENEDFYRGFLAGAYDAEGEKAIASCRFGNTDEKMLDDFCWCLDALGFEHKYHKPEKNGQKIVYFGGMLDKIRFQHETGMDMSLCNIEGISTRSQSSEGNCVVAIEPLAEFRELYDITTSTENFIANGMISHNCFSQYQRGIGAAAEKYLAKDVHSVNVDKIKKMFLEPDSTQFGPYIKARKVMQWGGLSDQFDGFEKHFGVTLELLRFFREIDYPICFSTKGVWWLDDPRYTELFKDNKNWNCKFSIITENAEHAAAIEVGVPSPQERLKAIEKYAALNAGGATIRFRPFIIGVSNKTYVSLLEHAADAGATACSTEFFCVETRNTASREKFKIISDIAGFDIFEFYRRYSLVSGYLRLNRKVKAPFIMKMKEICDRRGMRFYVSDPDFKDACHNGSCCGLPEDWNYSRGQLTEAICIARKKGTVRYSDISPDINLIFSNFIYERGQGLNTNSAMNRAKFINMTMAEHVHYMWNSPKLANSPYGIFRGSLAPVMDERGDVVRDENGDIIYRYVDRGDMFHGCWSEKGGCAGCGGACH